VLVEHPGSDPTDRNRAACLSRLFVKTRLTKEWYMSLRKIALVCAASLFFSGCASIAGSTSKMLSDDRIKSETSGALGYAPNDLTLVSRRTEGVNTYVSLKAKDGKEFTCIINGGNWLSMGLTNPPMCSKKGEPIRSTLL
jgi:hypothetical protein